MGNVNAVITDRKMVSDGAQVFAQHYFDYATEGWLQTSNSPSQSNGQLFVNVSNSVYRTIGVVAGRTYTVDITATKGTAPNLELFLFGVTPSTYALTSGATTLVTFTATTTNASLGVIIRATAAGNYNFQVQDVVIKSHEHYDPVVIMKSDYYPFGMQMPNRTATPNNYRFGYNGMEKDPEMKGDGNSYTTEFRQYDPRLGRWASLDPLMMMFPNQSPYCAFDNNPIVYTDPYGLEATNKDGNSGVSDGGDGGDPFIPPGLPETNNGVPWAKDNIFFSPETGNSYVFDGENWGFGAQYPDDFCEITAKPSGWTRFWGVVKGIGGTVEAVVGVGLIVTGVGGPLGAVLLVHGCDVAASGFTQAYTGKETQSFTYQGIHKASTSLGASDETADMIAGGTEIVLSGAAGGATTKVPGTLSTSTTVATSESIIIKTEEVIETVVSNGTLTDEFVKGVQLEGSYDISKGIADFTIDYFKNTSGIKNYALSNLTSKFEGMAQVSGVNQVRIVFKEVVNTQLKNNSAWAAKYGYTYEYVPNDGYGTVIWSKTLK